MALVRNLLLMVLASRHKFTAWGSDRSRRGASQSGPGRELEAPRSRCRLRRSELWRTRIAIGEVAELHERVGRERGEHRRQLRESDLDGGRLSGCGQTFDLHQEVQQAGEHLRRRCVDVLLAGPEDHLVDVVQLTGVHRSGGEGAVDRASRGVDPVRDVLGGRGNPVADGEHGDLLGRVAVLGLCPWGDRGDHLGRVQPQVFRRAVVERGEEEHCGVNRLMPSGLPQPQLFHGDSGALSTSETSRRICPAASERVKPLARRCARRWETEQCT